MEPNIYSNPDESYMNGSMLASIIPMRSQIHSSYDNYNDMNNFNSSQISNCTQENKKSDINNLLHKILSITEQSLKEAEKRLFYY